jgi:hypothetical protein
VPNAFPIGTGSPILDDDLPENNDLANGGDGGDGGDDAGVDGAGVNGYDLCNHIDEKVLARMVKLAADTDISREVRRSLKRGENLTRAMECKARPNACNVLSSRELSEPSSDLYPELLEPDSASSSSARATPRTIPQSS